MVRIDLRGVAKVTAKGRNYYYAWRGGPRLRGEPGTPEFITSYNDAFANRRTPEPGRFKSVVIRYRASTDYAGLADSTRKNWGPWLDRIADHWGELRTAQFDRPEKIRKLIRQWRNKWSDTPRTADYGMQVFSRVLAFAVEAGDIASNPCNGIAQLYSNDRSEIIWTDADIAALKKTCPVEVARAVDLAAHTGLRLGDLLRLSWSHVGEHAIILATGKSSGRREAIIPLYDRLRSVLADIPKRATTILTNSKRRPWRPNGFGTAFNRAKIKAGMHESDLHFHDLRGTAATKSTLPNCRNARSPKSWLGAKTRWIASFAAMLNVQRRPRRLFVASIISPKKEHELAKLAAKPRRQKGSKYWSGRWESNPRHSAWEADVLPLNYARKT
jgi:integrase